MRPAIELQVMDASKNVWDRDSYSVHAQTLNDSICIQADSNGLTVRYVSRAYQSISQLHDLCRPFKHGPGVQDSEEKLSE